MNEASGVEADGAVVDAAPSRPAEPRRPGIVPEWLANLAALGWRILAIGALVVILWLIASLLWTVTASIAVAVVIAAFFAPSVVNLRRRGMSSMAAAAIVWVAALVIVVGAALLLAIALLPYLSDILGNLQQLVAEAKSALAAMNVPPAVGQALDGLLGALRDASGGTASAIVAQAAQVGTILVLAAFLVFFFLKDGDRAWLWIFQGASLQNRARITEAGENALWRVGGYLRGTTVLAAIMAVTDFVFLWILGVPLALSLAVLVFFMGYIPYFGSLVANLLVLGVTWVTVGAVPTLVLLLLIAVRSAVLAYGLRPLIYGRSVNVHPALVLIALPAGLELAGIVGLFAAVPVTAIVFAVAEATVAILDPGPVPERPALVPGWLDRVAQWSVRLLVAFAFLALVVGIAVSLPLVVIPVLLALIIAATLLPAVNGLVRRGRSRTAAAAILTGGGFLGVLAVLGLTLWALVDQAVALGAGTTAGAARASDAAGGRLDLGVQAVAQGTAGIVSGIIAFGESVAATAAIVILSTLIAFYFLKDGAALWGRLVGRSGPEMAPAVGAAGSRAVEVLGGYMIGTGLISLVGAASQLVIMIVLGIPLALPVFVLSFVLCFIPYIGGFISTGLAFLLTVAFGTTEAIVVMAIWTLVFNLVTGNVVGPLVYGRTVHLHPAVVLVAIPAGGAVAGVLGMFVVVPAMGVVAATWRTVFALIGRRRRELDGAAEDAPGLPPGEMAAPALAVPGPPDSSAATGQA